MIITRLWHYQLLPYLPDAQFKGQLRELVAIMHDWRDKGKTNHVLINKVMEYPKQDLVSYFFEYRKEYLKRYGKDIKDKTIEDFLFFVPDEEKEIKYSDEFMYWGWHNDTYLNICMYNLLEKHLGVGKSRVTDEEWERLCEGYRQICGKDFAV